MAETAKLLAVIKREYLERVRTKWFIISTVFGPVFFLGISVVPGLLTARNIRDTQLGEVQILDATGAGLGERLAKALRERPPVSLLAPSASGGRVGVGAQLATPTVNARVKAVSAAELAQAESTVTHSVMAGTTRGYVVLDSAAFGGKARFAGRSTGFAEVGHIESALRSALIAHRLASVGIVDARADSLTRVRVDVTSERITEKGRGESGIAAMIFGFLIAFLLYMMIILYGQNILRGVLEEKTTRVAEVVISSISPDTLLAGKVIGVGAVGLTQQLVWLAFAAGLSLYGLGMAASMGIVNISLPHVSVFQLVCLVLFFLLGYTFYAALFAAVGAMCSSQEEATQAAQPVMMLLVASIILVQPIMTTPTGTMAKVMSMLPFSAPIIMPLVMASTDVPTWQVVVAILGLVAACAGAIWLSARIYRVGLLMTGKRPSLKELVRWVRYA